MKILEQWSKVENAEARLMELEFPEEVSARAEAERGEVSSHWFSLFFFSSPSRLSWICLGASSLRLF